MDADFVKKFVCVPCLQINMGSSILQFLKLTMLMTFSREKEMQCKPITKETPASDGDGGYHCGCELKAFSSKCHTKELDCHL